MYKLIKKSRAIQSVIILFTVLIMITIFPFRMWNESIPSVSNQVMAGSSDSVGEDYMLQRFIAQYDHLGTINLYLTDFQNGWNKDARVDRFIFRMLDSDMQIMFEEEVDIRFIDIPGFCPIYINEDLEVGKDYYYFLQGIDGSRVWFGLEKTEDAGTKYVSRLVYNYDELPGYNVIGEYQYSVPLRKDKIFTYDMILLLLAAVAVGIVELFYRKFGKDKLITVERAMRYTANLAVGAAAFISVYAISIRGFFSGRLTDNIFYTIGTLLFAGILFYGINKKRDRNAYVPLKEKVKEHWPDFLRIVFIAGAVWACCNYMNGLYDIHHRIAERQLMVFFALAILTMFKKKEIVHVVSFLYMLIAGGVIIWYNSIYVDTIAMDVLDLRALRYGIAALFLAGFVVVQLILCFVHKRKIKQISAWYGAVVGIFFILIIVFRNTRWWTVALSVSFTLFYLAYAFWDKKERLLQNICDGLILNFICSMLFCFMRRPFLSWVYPRYPFIFHTVTVTAVYMTIIMCAALIRLTDKYRKSHKLGDIWLELTIMGISGTYMIFTASRTGLLSVGVMMVIGVIATASGIGKERWKNIGGLCAWMAAALIWCFPAVFTAQRILPAVNDNVFKYEVEVFPDAITRGNEWDSMYYITINRFIEVFNNKIFDIPESGSGSYERSEEYQKYRAKRFNSKGDVVWEGSIKDTENTADNGAVLGEDSSLNGEGDQKLNIIGTKTQEERTAEEEQAKELEKAAKETDFTEENPEEETVIEDTSVYEKTEEYANGRMDIFRAYLEQLNLTGHDDMGAYLPDGELAVHAHNIYIQVAYDHGIIVGIIFIIVGAATFIQGCIFYRRRKDEVSCAFLPVVVVVAFAVAGIAEWVFHLCHPAGFTLLLVLAPLLFGMGDKHKLIKDKVDEKR